MIGPSAANFEALIEALKAASSAADRASAFSIGHVLNRLLADARREVAHAAFRERMAASKGDLPIDDLQPEPTS